MSEIYPPWWNDVFLRGDICSRDLLDLVASLPPVLFASHEVNMLYQGHTRIVAAFRQPLSLSNSLVLPFLPPDLFLLHLSPSKVET